MQLEVIILSQEMLQNSPRAISDFNILPQDKPPDPAAATSLTGRSIEAGCFLIKVRGSKTEKSCFEQKNAWSRFTLILFKLHEIW